MVLVRPSKFWHKPGVSGKEAWETWHNYCTKVPGNLSDSEACMKSQGFKYGKTDDIYVPPLPPKRGWVKPGVSYMDAVSIRNECDTVGNVTYSNVSPSCSGAISFTPQAGQDYEVGFAWQGRTCQLSVNQIVEEGGETRLVPVPVEPAPKC